MNVALPGPAAPTTVSTEPARIGVLALQGDVREHLEALEALGAPGFAVRTLEQLEAADGLIVPGGESTTIARLLLAFELHEPLRAAIAAGLPVWGTCAGAILLAKRAPGLDRPTLGLLDVTAERNAFGRQVDSFEADLEVAGLDGPEGGSAAGVMRAVFIRAPRLREAGPGVEVLARLPDGSIAACREGRMLATAFHPELTDDRRLHARFLDMVEEARADGRGRAVSA
ncbi:MAG: pyridoxal 5'-phosphate synthase glutaminase subunit PdxT [Chloroflexi bacterium]|nr:pyridoxal 5'-phosphate synthase glutaminase subunit PdxT [Chloroflexota bacterium]